MEQRLNKQEVLEIMDNLLEELAIAIEMTEDYGHAMVIRELKKQYQFYDSLVDTIVLSANNCYDVINYDIEFVNEQRILQVTDHFLECIELSYEFLGKPREVRMILALKNELYRYNDLLCKLIFVYDPTMVKYFTI